MRQSEARDGTEEAHDDGLTQGCPPKNAPVQRAATTSYGDGPKADGRLVWMDDQERAVRTFRGLGYDREADYVQQWIDRAGPGGPVRDLSGQDPAPQARVGEINVEVMVGMPPGDAAGNIPYLPDLLDD